MALRNLTGDKRLETDSNATEEKRRDDPSHPDTSAEVNTSALPESKPLLEVEIQIPSTPASEPPQAKDDPFLASLEALRRTLRHPTPQPEKPTTSDPQDAVTTQRLEPVSAPEKADEATPNTQAPKSEATDTEDEKADDTFFVSPLEDMPLPSVEKAPTPLPRRAEQTPSRTPIDKQVSDNTPDAPADSLDSALQAVRKSVGLPEATNGLKRPFSTPRPKKRRPLSDGIPKSVSEDLPKFRGKPRMRICNRCGHETKLRSPECQSCGKVDESLGILDAVISGDLAKVEQILLVRPHLISVRTSRHEWTLLHMAASGGNPKMVELLVSKGAAVNATNRDGKTPLHYAAGKGHMNVVEVLLAHHADADLRYHDKSAADLAHAHGQKDVEALLRNYKPPK